MVEEWRAVVGYEGLYEVSNTGKVRSVTHMIHVNWNGHEYDRVVRGKLLQPKTTNNTRYLRIDLCDKNHVKKEHLIHRLVAQAFIPNPNNYPMINHKDENRWNNNVDNLEWCTASYNNNYNDSQKRRAITRKLNKR